MARKTVSTPFMVTYFVGGARLHLPLAALVRSLRGNERRPCALGASFFSAALIVWAVGSWESEGSPDS